MRYVTIGLLLLLMAAARVHAVTTTRIATGLEQPLFVTVAPGDSDRLYIVERPGRIRVWQDGQVTGTFLDIREQIESGGSEQGLLGLAFHPQFIQNRRFFVNYTREPDGATIVSRWTAAGADQADAQSEQIIFTQPQPFSNHNGGQVSFGPDGYLYIGLGDGGAGGDPANNGQNLDTLLGKLLRIDVNGDNGYAIPPDNPFAGAAAGADEIWAYGLRNPWRFAFDRETGDLYIADVGQNEWEEVHFAPASSEGGENYGWRLMEGNHCFNPPENCNPGGLVLPIHEYGHGSGCSITGGYVYRGCAIPELAGHYFFADYCSNRIWSFRYRSGGITDLQERTAALRPANGGAIEAISSFGEDHYGELYICDLGDGEIFKIVPDTLVDQNGNGIPDGCEGLRSGGTERGEIRDYRLYPGFPNPFNPRTEIAFDLPRSGTVELVVFDLSGRQVVTLVRESLPAGRHHATFDGTDFAAGVYICRLRAGTALEGQKLVLLK